MALTATASKKVQDDILKQLSLDDHVEKFKGSTFRSNLFYDVVMKDLIATNPEVIHFFRCVALINMPLFARIARESLV